MENNSKKEIEYLKKLIRYGDKLDIDTLKYQRELKRLDKTAVISKPKPKKYTNTSQTKSKYTIRSVKAIGNSIIIDFNHKINKSYIDFIEKKTKYAYYDSFDIKGNFKDAKPTKLKINGVDKITVVQKNQNTLTISLRDKVNLKTIYILAKHRIIIKVLDLKKQKNTQSKKIKEKVKMIDSKALYPAQKVIVLDAGHGGKDAGAVGGKNLYEKNIVLSIVKYTKQYLERKGFKVHLTRSSDKFVKLSRRTKYANGKNADVFISIHANAARKSRASKAHGIETYFLSPARSARAKRVAALENKGDMNKMGWSSKNSLLTILNRSKIVASNKMAIDIQKNMLYKLRNKYGEKAIRDGGVREGPFWVLVGAQMPAVLVEVGYISHPTEKRRMNTKTYQRLTAQGIADGIESYFIKNF